MMHRFAVFHGLILICVLHTALCSDVLSEVGSKFEQLERWSDGKKFVWDVEVLISFEMDPSAYEILQRSVTQRGGHLEGRSYTYRTDFQISAGRKGKRLVINGKGTNGRLDTPLFLFIDEGLYIVGTYPIYAIPPDSQPDRITEAYIFACRQDLRYSYIFPQPFLFVEPGDAFLYGLLVNISPLRLYSDRPKITLRGQTWELEGEGGVLRSKIISHIDSSNKSLKKIINILESHKGYQKKAEYHFVEMNRTNNVDFPVHIRYRKVETSPEQKRKVIVDFKLRRVDSLSEKDLEITLPLGTQVHDFRQLSRDWEAQDYSNHFSQGDWSRVVRYRWQGVLPDVKTLKQLAYQQGNLIPPDTPRRRFSLLLFAPAIIFFALAAYLYFRNRRR